ncbi:hypothetical protein GALMADRAFT_1196651 [Galerina marginata CBS 339.88]|uniref:Kinetochore protein Sos7 coiled-coil domain-containing protein n=1 Tax=Galerina marginata (strain CBS 339.88) TaxID=685588 RepID=A0A067TDJ0_GALM3|nr:hypothetical protein GALMADRAFT_1196651 [Galerina marginata CBS 339.88]
MSGSRPSLELPTIEQTKNVQVAKTLTTRLESLNIQLVNKAAEFNSHRLETDDGLDPEDAEAKDPAIVAMQVATQIADLRKLKFQYLEQNAKDKYVKSIVSDIDDAPIVTAEQNKELSVVNEEKKEKLKSAKEKLAEAHNNIKLLAPMVEQDYQQLRQATDRAALLSQKIIDARTSLMLLRQTHPRPRLTIPLADQKLADQVEEMQTLSDQVQAVKQKAKAEKLRVKSDALDVENLRVEAAEAEKAVKTTQMDEDDSRLVPLYDWFTASLALQRSICNLDDSHSESENELRLTYKLDMPPPSLPHHVTIILIFAPDTRRLAAAQISGLDELGIEAGDVVDAHVQVNDVHGLVAAILARARAAVST